MKNILRSTLFTILFFACVEPMVLAKDPVRLFSRPDPEPKNDAAGLRYYGVVTEVTKISITLQYESDPPKCFPVSQALSAGNITMQPRPLPMRIDPYPLSPTEMYRLTDVNVGDWVALRYTKLNGTITCEHIRIEKRPGGLVPPLPKEAEELRHPEGRWKLQHPGQTVPKGLKKVFDEFPTPIPYHEERNAYWDLEDRGIPYPEKFGDKRRWLTAPMPREVQPTPKPKV